MAKGVNGPNRTFGYHAANGGFEPFPEVTRPRPSHMQHERV
jgi:hypothetical protein